MEMSTRNLNLFRKFTHLKKNANLCLAFAKANNDVIESRSYIAPHLICIDNRYKSFHEVLHR